MCSKFVQPSRQKAFLIQIRKVFSYTMLWIRAVNYAGLYTLIDTHPDTHFVKADTHFSILLFLFAFGFNHSKKQTNDTSNI